MAFFQVCGISPVVIDRFIRSARYLRATGPRCFRCNDEMPSGPMALDGFAFLNGLLYISCSPRDVIVVFGSLGNFPLCCSAAFGWRTGWTLME